MVPEDYITNQGFFTELVVPSHTDPPPPVQFPPTSLMFILRPKMSEIKKVAKIINAHSQLYYFDGPHCEYSVLFVPRATEHLVGEFEKALDHATLQPHDAESGAPGEQSSIQRIASVRTRHKSFHLGAADSSAGSVMVYPRRIGFVPIMQDVMTLGLPKLYRDLMLDTSGDSLQTVVDALLLFEQHVCLLPIPHITARGDKAVEAVRLLKKQRATTNMPPVEECIGVGPVDHLIVIDRNCDMISPMITQTMYEGMLEAITINTSIILMMQCV